MALSAALAAQSLRPASSLPAIKCSQCGQEIEIAHMADHLCSGAHEEEPTSYPASTQSSSNNGSNYGGHQYSSPEPQSLNPYNPFTLRQMNANGQKPATSPLQYSATAPPGTQTPVVAPPQMVAPKPMRMAPPRIDSGTANRPFLAPRPPRSDSPMSPAISVRSGRSGRSNIFDLRPPSPELTGNMDCAFPPFPTAPPPRPSSRSANSAGRRTPASDRSESRNHARPDGRSANDASHGFEPMSPRGNRDDGMQRPYESRLRRPSEASTMSSNDRRRPSASGSTRDELPPLPTEPLPSNAAQMNRPTTPGNNFSRPGAPVAMGKPAFPTRSDSSDEDSTPRTFVDQQELDEHPGNGMRLDHTNGEHEEAMNTLTQITSEPQLHVDQERPPLTAGPDSEPARVPQFRARSSSRATVRTDFRLEDAPPVPKPVQQTKQDSSHSPSESNSSAASMMHSENNSTSDPSPIGSAASSLDTFSPLSYTSGQYELDNKMAVAGLSVKPMQTPESDLAPLRSPPRNFARPGPPRQLALVPGPNDAQTPDNAQAPAMPFGSTTPMESPADPMLLTNKFYQAPPVGPNFRPMPTRTATTPNFAQPQPAPAGALPSLPRGPTRSKSNASLSSRSGFRGPVQAPPVPDGPPRSQMPSRRPTNGKATCRGCGLIIEGKSIKAADGRLTGRWHKACFTCKTCEQPFTTADFYVIDNLPYCEQHYHEKNGSCCHGCRKGIEGQYLETSSGTSGDKKFHPRCFTCVDCREVLVDDCFELAGKVYCERHALAAMRGQARMAGSPLASGLSPTDRRGLTAERRTTRLMMM